MKKRILSFGLVICMLWGFLPGARAADGSESAPFLISSAEELRALSAEDTAGMFYSLGENIDLLNEAWSPLGGSLGFQGHFLGNGHQITGLYVNGTASSTGAYWGLFGLIGPGGEVRDLVVSGTIQVGNGSSFAGGIAGKCEGLIQGCTFSGDITVSGEGQIAGGIAGALYGEASDCGYPEGSLRAAGDRHTLGGLAGMVYTDGELKNSYSWGSVMQGEGNGSYLGGIAGTTLGAIYNCYQSGNLLSDSAYVGGIAGSAGGSATLDHCFWSTGSTSKAIGSGSAAGKSESFSAAGSILDSLNTWADAHTARGWILDGSGMPTLDAPSAPPNPPVDPTPPVEPTTPIEPGKPTITLQPQDLDLDYGTGGSLTVAAEGEGLSFQWQEKCAGAWEAMPGEEGTTLLLPERLSAGAYTYRCVISGGNGSCVESSAATVQVAARPVEVVGTTAEGRRYDGTRSVSLTPGNLTGALDGDDVALVSTGLTGTVETSDAGLSKAVAVEGYVLGGTAAGNYRLAQPHGLTVDISRAELTIVGVQAVSRPYNGQREVTLAGGVLSGVIGGDDIALESSAAAGMVAASDAGENKPVTAAGYALSGASAHNYTLAQPTGLTVTIGRAALEVEGVRAVARTYDGTVHVALTGGALPDTAMGDLRLDTSAAAGALLTPDAGAGRAVLASCYTLSGTDAGNYELLQPTGLTVDIGKAPLTVAGMQAEKRVYDGTTHAALTGGTLLGVYGHDDVALDTASATGTMADANVGADKTVTVSGCTLTGVDAGNYALSQPTGLAAEITAAPLGIIGLQAIPRAYDGTCEVALTGGALSGVLGRDEVVLDGSNARGTVETPGAANGKAVTVTGATLSGSGAGNYYLTQLAGLLVDISKRELIVTAEHKTVCLGDSLPDFTARFEGFVPGEGAGDLGGTLAFACAADLSTAGSSPITPSGLSSENYDLRYVDGTLTVTDAVEAPTMSYVVTGSKGADGWYTGPVSISPAEGFTLSEDLSGPFGNGGITLTADTSSGSKIVYIKDSGGQKYSAVVPYRLDTQAPQLSWVRDEYDDAVWYSAAILSAGAEDATSGVTRLVLLVSKDGGAAAEHPSPVALKEFGVYTITAEAVDRAGNRARLEERTVRVEPTIGVLLEKVAGLDENSRPEAVRAVRAWHDGLTAYQRSRLLTRPECVDALVRLTALETAIEAADKAVRDFLTAESQLARPLTHGTRPQAEDLLRMLDALGSNKSQVPQQILDDCAELSSLLLGVKAVEDAVGALPSHLPGPDCDSAGDGAAHRTAAEAALFLSAALTAEGRAIAAEGVLTTAQRQYAALLDHLNYVNKMGDLSIYGLAERMDTSALTSRYPEGEVRLSAFAVPSVPKTDLAAAEAKLKQEQPELIRLASYDITVQAKVLKDGQMVAEESVQPKTGQNILLKLALGNQVRTGTVRLLHVAGASIEEITAEQNGLQVLKENGVNYLLFQVDHLSHFVLYAVTEKAPVEPERPQPPAPPSGSGGAAQPVEAKGFADIKGHWAEDAVEYVTKKGLMDGTGERLFSPDVPLTRSEAAELFRRLYGSKEQDSAAWAESHGILIGNGVSQDLERNLTRQELGLLFLRYARLSGEGPVGAWAIVPDCADWGEVAPWAQESAMYACKLGLITGKPGNRFAPGDLVTRAEMAAMVQRFCENILK